MYKRILTIQDISCVGQCSLTVALPILSACGLETAILPSALLSTHTAGFKGYTVRDLTEDMIGIKAHWMREGIKFDAIYTGYLGSIKQIDIVLEIMKDLRNHGAPAIIDPAMGDNGKLYPAFNQEYVEEMKKLAFTAEIILPNITEACLLTGIEYKETYDETYTHSLIDALHNLGAGCIVLTGVGYTPDTTGVIVSGQLFRYYKHHKVDKDCHGTGDVFASAFTGSYLQGDNAYDAAVIAADYVVKCIELTKKDPNHWYGVKFERHLNDLIEDVLQHEDDEEPSIWQKKFF